MAASNCRSFSPEFLLEVAKIVLDKRYSVAAANFC